MDKWEKAFRELVTGGFGTASGAPSWKWIEDVTIDDPVVKLSPETRALVREVLTGDPAP
jgi:hypothetical protein